MLEFCTCGAQLPPDALFCHKCGKPQREIAIPETVVTDEPPAIVPVPEAQPTEGPPLNFRNRLAVRTALLVAVPAVLLSFIPILNSFGAGFFAVFLYRKRSGSQMNLESGVRIGWMTGLVMFGILAVLLAGVLLMVQAVGGLPAVQAELKNATDPRVMEALKTMQSGPDVIRQLIQLFVMTTLLTMAGGAVSAKIMGRD